MSTTDPESVPTVLLFGPQGTDFSPTLRSLLASLGLLGDDATGSDVSSAAPSSPRHTARIFLRLALNALRSETVASAAYDNNDNAAAVARRRSSWHTVLNHQAQSGWQDAAVNGALLCATQIAVAIVGLGSGQSEPPPLYVAGYCTGLLPALALALSGVDIGARTWDHTHSDVAHRLLAASVQAVRLCFWIGFRAARAPATAALPPTDGVEGEGEGEDGDDDDDGIELDGRRHAAWTIAVTGLDEALVRQLLDRWNEQTETTASRALYISAITSSSEISISGPPPALYAFRTWIEETNKRTSKSHPSGEQPPRPRVRVRALPLKIFAPYHTRLYGADAAAELVMKDAEARGIQLPTATATAALANVFSTVDGRRLDLVNMTSHDLLRHVLHAVLLEPCAWDKVQSSLVQSISALNDQAEEPSAQVHVRVLAAGSSRGLAAQLADALGKTTTGLGELHVDVVDLAQKLSSSSSSVPPSLPSAHHLAADGSWDGDTEEEPGPDDIAVVSVACRFPGEVQSPDALKETVDSGKNTAVEFPSFRFDMRKYFSSVDDDGSVPLPRLHAVSDIDLFDPRFFGLSPRETEQMDPQQRLSLLVSQEALERAGYSPPFEPAAARSEWNKKRIGCWWAVASDDYRHNASHEIGPYFVTGNIRAFVPGHVSYLFGWEGPSISVDAGDCSSHVAIHQATAALASGQCDVALAGAVHVVTQPSTFLAMRAANPAAFTSEHDQRGEGCGVLVLKRHCDALAHGDNVLAVIKAVNVGFDPRSRDADDDGPLGSNMASAEAQADSLRTLFRRAKADPARTVSVWPTTACANSSSLPELDTDSRADMHPSERQALQDVFRSRAADADGGDAPRVSSVNAAVGAAEAAFGMAQVISAVMDLQPPRSRPESESRDDGRSYAVVNGLSRTGTYASILLQSPRSPLADGQQALEVVGERAKHLILLSAKSVEALEQRRTRLVAWLDERRRDAEPNLLSLLEVATSACGVQHRPFRLAVSATSLDDLVDHLRSAEAFEIPAEEPDVGFLLAASDTPAGGQSTESFNPLPDSFWASFYADLRAALSVARAHVPFFSESPTISRFCRQYALARQYARLGLQPMCLSADDAIGLCVCLHLAGSLGLAELMCLIYVVKAGSAQNLPDEPVTVAQFLNRLSPAPSSVRIMSHRSRLLVDRDQRPDLSKLFGRHSDAGEDREPTGVEWIPIPDPRTSSGGGEKVAASDHDLVLDQLASLYRVGVDIDWLRWHGEAAVRLTKPIVARLPTYPFQLSSFWMAYRDRTKTSATTVVAEQSSEPDGADEAAGTSKVPTLTLARHRTACPLVPTCLSLVRDPQGLCEVRFEPAAETALSVKDFMSACCPVDDPAGRVPLAFVIEAIVEAMVHAQRQLQDSHTPIDMTGLLVLDCKGLDGDGELRDLCLSGCWDPAGSHPMIKAAFGNGIRSSLSFLPAHPHPSVWWRGSLNDAGKSQMGKRVAYRVLDALGFSYPPAKQAISNISVTDGGRMLEARVDVALGAPTGFTVRGVSVLDTMISIAYCSCAAKLRGTTKVTTISQVGKIAIALDRLDAASANGALRVFCRLSAGTESALTRADLVLIDEEMLDYPLVHLQDVEVVAVDKKPSRARAPPATERPSKRAVPAKEDRSKPAMNAADRKNEQRLAELHDVIMDEMGVEKDEVGPDANLLDLGLDSLMSLSILSRAREQFDNVDFPSDLFQECPTLRKIDAWVRQATGTASSVAPDEPVAPADTVSQTASETPVAPSTGSPQASSAFRSLLSILSEELGVPEDELKHQVDLADLGVDSLMSIVVLSTFREAHSIDLPSDLFIKYPRLVDVEGYLNGMFEEQPTVAPSQPTAPAPVQSLNGHGTQVESSMKPSTPLMLQKGPPDSTTSLFIFPDGSGSPAVYAGLPPLGMTVWGLSNPFVNDPAAWKGGVEELASLYWRSIQMVKPKGRVIFGGWSFGGVVAYETCRQLCASGGSEFVVDTLILFDSPSPARYPPLPPSCIDWIFKSGSFRGMASRKLTSQMEALFGSTLDNLERYECKAPRLSVQRVVLITAADGVGGSLSDVEGANSTVEWMMRSRKGLGLDGWEPLLSSVPETALSVHEVDGANHFSMWKEPHVRRIGDILSETL